MRIRKRFLFLSAAITADPRHPPTLPLRVQQKELHPDGSNQRVGYVNTGRSQLPDPSNQCDRPPLPSPSDHTTQIGLQPATLVPSGDPNNTKILNELDSERVKELTKTHDMTGCRKDTILCAEANNHDLVMKGWLEGDRLLPIRKKRGSFGRRLINNDVVQDNEGTMEPKAKRNDKHVAIMNSKKNNKNEKSEGVIMEGSRCSRVNGRGWRCSQQTLVGYSLCEHHLGKGRLRSMASVRGRAQRVAPNKQHTKVEDRDDDVEDDNDNDDDDEFKDWDVESMEGTRVFSKKTKLGMVKARSLSSLLSQISS